MSIIIGVIGPSHCDSELYKLAEETGEWIAKNNAILICGGLGGVMEAVAKGCKKGGGLTIGIIPGFNKSDANKYIDIPIVTGLDQARNIIIVRTADAIIAIDGGYGTLSEIGYALKLNVPIVGLNTWQLSKNGKEDKNIIVALTPHEAVEKAIRIIKKKSSVTKTIDL